MLVSLRIIMTDDSESKFSGFALVYGTITQQSEREHTSLLFRSVQATCTWNLLSATLLTYFNKKRNCKGAGKVGTYIIGNIVNINSSLGVSLDDSGVWLNNEEEWLSCPYFEDDILGRRVVSNFELGDCLARRECDLL